MMRSAVLAFALCAVCATAFTITNTVYTSKDCSGTGITYTHVSGTCQNTGIGDHANIPKSQKVTGTCAKPVIEQYFNSVDCTGTAVNSSETTDGACAPFQSGSAKTQCSAAGANSPAAWAAILVAAIAALN